MTRRKARRYPKGVHVFRLHPEPHTAQYVLVLVFPDKKSLYLYRPLERRHAACCTQVRVESHRKGKRPRVKPIFAEVCFQRGGLGMEIVAHELLHAAIAYARLNVFNFCRLDAVDSVNDQEEWFTHVHSTLCNRFMLRAIAARLYEELPTATKVPK